MVGLELALVIFQKDELRVLIVKKDVLRGLKVEKDALLEIQRDLNRYVMIFAAI